MGTLVVALSAPHHNDKMHFLARTRLFSTRKSTRIRALYRYCPENCSIENIFPPVENLFFLTCKCQQWCWTFGTGLWTSVYGTGFISLQFPAQWCVAFTWFIFSSFS